MSSGRATRREQQADMALARKRQDIHSIRVAGEEAAQPDRKALPVACQGLSDHRMQDEGDALGGADLFHISDTKQRDAPPLGRRVRAALSGSTLVQGDGSANAIPLAS